MSGLTSPVSPTALPATLALIPGGGSGPPNLAAFVDLMIGQAPAASPGTTIAIAGDDERQEPAADGKDLPDGRHGDPALAWLLAGPLPIASTPPTPPAPVNLDAAPVTHEASASPLAVISPAMPIVPAATTVLGCDASSKATIEIPHVSLAALAALPVDPPAVPPADARALVQRPTSALPDLPPFGTNAAPFKPGIGVEATPVPARADDALRPVAPIAVTTIPPSLAAPIPTSPSPPPTIAPSPRGPIVSPVIASSPEPLDRPRIPIAVAASTRPPAAVAAAVSPPLATAPLPALFALAALRDRAASDRDERAMLPGIGTVAPDATIATMTAIAPAGDAQRAPLDTGRQDWPQKMIEHIEVLRDNANATDTSIRLKPEALGRVDVAVRSHENGAVSVHFTAEQPATRTLIADAAPQLREAAAARGIRLGETSVDLSGQRDPRARPEVERRQPITNRFAATGGDDIEAVDDGRIA